MVPLKDASRVPESACRVIRVTGNRVFDEKGDEVGMGNIMAAAFPLAIAVAVIKLRAGELQACRVHYTDGAHAAWCDLQMT